MDNQNIIELTNDINALEIDMNNWQKLNYEQRKRSDLACIEKYGCTNLELYNSIKSNIFKNESSDKEPVYINESFQFLDNEYNDESKEILLSKIEDSLFVQKQDKNIIIIDDFLLDPDNVDDEIETLIKKYEKYTLSNNNYKIYSNEYSLQIWGKTVTEMFEYVKAKLQKIKSENNKNKSDFFITPTDKALIYYQKDIDKIKKEKNFIEYSIKAIDCFDKHETLYENAVLEKFVSENNKVIFSFESYKDDVPKIVPFLDYDEYIQLNNDITDDISPFSYIFIDDAKKYYSLISNLSSEYKKGKKSLKDQLLKLGWNPEVEVNADTLKYARVKQINWLNQNEKCNIFNLSDTYIKVPQDMVNESDVDIHKLEPVFIVLVHTGSLFGKVINKYKKSVYSHAGISLSPTLNEIYSFGIRKDRNENGLIIESLDDYNDKNNNSNLCLLALFVDPLIKRKIESNIKWYLDNQYRTKYSIKNIARIVLNKKSESAHSLEMVCSQFVDNILKMSNLDITNKPSNLVAPSDLDKPVNGTNLFVLFEGKKSNYDYREIQDKIDALKTNLEYRKLVAKEPQIIIKKIRENILETFMIKSDDKNIDLILKELREYVSIKPGIISIKEAKSPIGFNKKGELYLQLPQDLQSEYNEAHKLLSIYDQTNIQGIKNELARLFYLNSIIEKKLKKINKNKKPDQYKELIDLRARILNDYTTYFKLVKTIEKDFDFMEYMKSSDYYNKSIIIDDSTLKYSGSYIKKFISSILKK